MMRMMVVVLGFACFCLTGLAQAQDKAKANPTGTWKWTIMFNNQSRESTLKLKLEGDKLTGAMVGRNNEETKIEDGKFKDGEVSFKVTRERDGQKFVTEYMGKVTGDTIKGKMKGMRGDQAFEREWEAKRSKEVQ